MDDDVRLWGKAGGYIMVLPRSHPFLAMTDEKLRDTVGHDTTVLVSQSIPQPRGPMAKTSAFDAENSGSSPDAVAKGDAQ